MKKLNRVGEEYNFKVYGKVTIIKYLGAFNCAIQFEDGTIVDNVSYQHIKDGNVINPNFPSTIGIGYKGQGMFKSKVGSIPTKHYRIWQGMFNRCYGGKLLSYKDCTVIEEWHNFQNFAKWYDDNCKDGWHLDKDILVKGNKVYSPETCCFVPQKINSLFIKSNKIRGECPIGVTRSKDKFVTQVKSSKTRRLGTFNTSEEAFQVYKVAKESYIKEIAEIWKDKITPAVYQALINYEVEITD